ncbi:hypothetical protein TARUN_3954 [Trichoderma arundinaceum]|uniref:Uncharacterized protein n=1 Tax=Trichoderma arundinaceum TaxID=490622 RepID=A0A395NQE4_TRIAR|nr:hypothetical protein TARUN_3954 [Trichoderma arundinaceum]
MPRTGYDVTGTAPGSPASEAAARARQRNAPRNRTPRAGTPANPSHPDGDEQETPRASRIGSSTGKARADSPTYSQVNVAHQDRQGFQIQRRLPRQELYQNPLNMSSIRAADQGFSANFAVANLGVHQQQLWNNSQFHALPASQHGIRSHRTAYPDPESFAHNQATASTFQHQTATTAATSTATRAPPSHVSNEDTEMTSSDKWMDVRR